MYVGSEAFRTANALPIQKQRVTGYVGEVPFVASDIMAGSMTISNQCSDVSDYTLGGVYVGQLTMTFLRGFGVTIETWNGQEITVNFGLCIDEDTDIWEEFPLGTFTVCEANSVMEGIEIKAYDNMAKLDKVSEWQPVGTLYQVLNKICQRCGIALGMTQLEVEALPNGMANFGLWPDNDCSTYRDLLYWCAVTVGGFATINRSGELILKSFKQIYTLPDDTPTLNWDKRCTGAKVSDYRTYYRGINVTDAKTDEVKFYGALSGGPVYDLGKNPFIQYGTQTTKDNMCNEILGSVQVRLRPFEAQIMSAPIWELGDIISMTGGLAQGYESRTIVHSWSYTSGRGTSLACYGSNPALTSNNDPSETAASKSASLNGLSYKRYSNPNEITVMGAEEQVTDIYFTASKETDVEIWHEYLITTELTDPSMTVEAVYYLDGVELTRRPVETYADSADHILTLNYAIAVDEGNHRWEVFLEAHGGTVTLDAEDAIAVLKGQGLVKGDTWDGVIILGDEVPYFHIRTSFGGVTESLNIPDGGNIQNDTSELSDNFIEDGLDMVFYIINDNVVVTLIIGDQFAHCGEYLYCGMESVLL